MIPRRPGGARAGLRLIPLASCHASSSHASFLCLALAQNLPGTPPLLHHELEVLDALAACAQLIGLFGERVSVRLQLGKRGKFPSGERSSERISMAA